MKTLNLAMLLICLLMVPTPNAIAETSPDDLVCLAKGTGFVPYNIKTKIELAKNGVITEKGTCNRAIDTLRSWEDLVCGPVESGWAVFVASTGEKPGTSYWFNLSSCEKSLTFAQSGIACVPRGSGSGVYDFTNGFFIGNGFYYSDNECTWAAYSAAPNKVCAPYYSHSAIYKRRYNSPLTGELIFTSKQCFEIISK